MFSHAARNRARIPQGFTLIELLVVIAIIAILAAILFPVFAKAREKAYQTQCQSNQRQLAIGIMTYAQDHDETFPLPSNWTDATGLGSDSQVFDCPSTGLQGIPSKPDYGMNAFLYDIDPNSGAIVGAALGNILDPTRVELTADLGRITAASSGIPIKDQMKNPFPNSYTVTGFGTGSGDARHSGAAICSFADGHVKLLKINELGTGANAYALPRSEGRMYVNFSQCRNFADAKARLMSALGWPNSPGHNDDGCTPQPTGMPTDDSTFSPTAGWKISAPGAFAFGGGGNTYVQTDGAIVSLMVDAELAAGTVVTFGAVSQACETAFLPADNATFARSPFQKALTIDTANNFVQGGQLEGTSTYPYAGYTLGTWVPEMSAIRGKRTSLSAGTTKFRFEVTLSPGSGTPLWSTTGQKYQYLNQADVNTHYASSAVIAHTTFKVTTPTQTFMYDGPFIPYSYGFQQYLKYLSVRSGSMSIKQIYYNSGNSAGS